MKKVVKNNRDKSLFGTLALIAAGISALGGIGGAAINAVNQRKIAKANQKAALLSSNLENAAAAQLNEQQNLNYDANSELETLKTGNINTIDSLNTQFKCGGRKRMKRGGGTAVTKLNDKFRYI